MKVTMNVNEEGFTFFMDGFIILFDCPLERARLDHNTSVKCLEFLHNLFLEGNLVE